MIDTRCFLVLALAVSLLGCTEQTGVQAREAAPPAATGAQPKHAAPHAVPGSHEDWCGEHGVPESLCSRCNPALVAAFQATGDWCPEHGLPESQCLKCNPDLRIVRPPKVEGR